MSSTQWVTIHHEKGLHARPATVFVQTASSFDADVTIATADGDEADAKSSLDVLSLGAESGDEITLSAEGPDEEDAVDTLVDLVESDFEPADTDE